MLVELNAVPTVSSVAMENIRSALDSMKLSKGSMKQLLDDMRSIMVVILKSQIQEKELDDKKEELKNKVQDLINISMLPRIYLRPPKMHTK